MAGAAIEIGVGSFVMREHIASDVNSIAHFANNKNVSRNMRDRFPFPYTIPDAESWIALCKKEEAGSRLAIAAALDVHGFETATPCSESTRAVGGIAFTRGSDVHRFSAEIGYWLGEPFWNNGVMTAAVKAYSVHLFKVTDLKRLWAGVYETNPASEQVLKNAGFVLEGRMRQSVYKDGVLLDQLLYAKLKP